jgi:aspartate kinase
MRFIVQKFGGTSVATAESRAKATNKIIAAKEEGYMPVIVVSAIGRKGDPYATDTLINMASAAHNDIPAREMDLLMACGEIISGIIMVATLQKIGHPAVFLTGGQAGIITDNSHNEARIIKINPEKIIKHAREGKIVVVAGFQGQTEEGEVTTLGRGGSDTTAAALGVALNAAYVDIFTDVEGIMTADPRIVSEAQTMEKVTYDEICQLAHQGAKVVHPRAIEIVMQKNIPLRVRSTFTDTLGTLVTSTGEVYSGAIDITRDRPITGITHIPNLVQFKITIEAGADSLAQQRRLFKSLALSGVSIDFINVYPNEVIFTVKEEVWTKTAQILENAGFIAQITPDCAKVAAIGAGMTGVPGIMANIVESLTKEDIQILPANDSYTTIWILVKRENMEKAVRALHNRFLETMG